jgi:hypothetical protein
MDGHTQQDTIRTGSNHLSCGAAYTTLIAVRDMKPVCRHLHRTLTFQEKRTDHDLLLHGQR